MDLVSDISIQFSGSAEQGWLNKIYKNEWQEIGLIYNANMAVYEKDRKTWDKHYNLEKPWESNNTLTDAWKEAAKNLLNTK